ncbi:MAG: GMC family oxidoreductase N-terminal domain-containing protein, partial [Pseudomonadota bacterium]
SEDFDHWRSLGNIGWGWDDVLSSYKKLEHWEGKPSPYRGQGGALNVSENRLTRGVSEAWLQAAVNAGYSANPDYNGAKQEGVGYFQMTMKNGLRCSSAKAFLKPARKRSNLRILTHAFARKILFDGQKAIGIDADWKGQSLTIKARGEIVLSAGSIASPQLLMVSGIGAPAHLQDHGISVCVAQKGVGQNLQDHLQARPVFKCRSGSINLDARSLFKKMMMLAEFALYRTGPMTMAASLATGFLRTDDALKRPDIQYHIQPFSADSPAEGTHKFSAFTASVLQLRPESTGEIKLKSSDMIDKPAIYPNYLSCEIDCQTMIKAIAITRKICQTSPLKELISEDFSPSRDIIDDDDVLNWVREHSTTIYHPTGTCKMGQDQMSVLDHRLCVRGIEALRVADASIMPVIVSGNTNAASMMIGEKAATMILEDAKKYK